MTPEEVTIKAAIEARLTVLRDLIAHHEREATSYQRLAQQHASEALRLSGGIVELESLASGFEAGPAVVGAPEQEIP